MKTKLIQIQAELKAPKQQKNNFGGYSYRSCEDILEAVKPLLLKYECSLTLTDSIEQIGDRYYIKATAAFNDGDKEKEVSAYAREALTKKGMDDAQITGSASSYARKYALNGLFLIDDTKDDDSTNDGKKEDKNLEDAFAQVKKAKDLSELQKVWSYYSDFHKDSKFKTAVTERKFELQNEPKK